MTTHTAQGITSTEHIFVAPRGSQTTDGRRSYVSGSRHRERDYWLTSEGTERREVINRRPLGDPRLLGSADLWMNRAGSISRTPEKLNAADLVRQADEARQAAARDFLNGIARHGWSGASGGVPWGAFERECMRMQAAGSGPLDVFGPLPIRGRALRVGCPASECGQSGNGTILGKREIKKPSGVNTAASGVRVLRRR